MMLFTTIDYLFKATRYGSWGIGILGVIASAILVFANLSLGGASALLFIATLLVSIAVVLLLAPHKLVSERIADKKRYIISGTCLGIAIAVGGLVYLTNGGFPEVNLLFV